MFKFDDNEYDPSPQEMAKMVETGVRELIDTHSTTVTTFIMNQPWMKQVSTIRYDHREGVLRTYGAMRCEYAEDQHITVCRSICYSFMMNVFRLTLLDGGSGVIVPELFDVRDPSINKFKIV